MNNSPDILPSMPTEPALPLVARCYRRLLWALPRDFREDFGEEMTAFLGLRILEAPSRWSRLRIGVTALAEVLFQGARERWRKLSPRHFGTGPSGTAPQNTHGPDKEPSLMSLDQLRQDLAFSVRTLRRSPIYTTVVVATLAIGIALNSLVFSVMNPFLLRPLPYADADRLVHLGGIDRQSGGDGGRFSAPQLADLKERSRAFDDLAGYFYGTRNLSGDQAAEQVTTSWGTANLFSVLGVDAVMGRALGPQDAEAGAPDVAVLTQGLWQSRFGGERNIVGRTVRIDGKPHTVVGILPASFNFPFNAVQLWLPMKEDPVNEGRADMGTLIIGRLAEGWTRETAQEEISAVQRELAAAYPDADGRYAGVALIPLREALNFIWDMLTTAFVIMLTGVGFVLIIACVNVASLTLARLGTRTREVALRQAMGAGRGRLIRQFLVEACVLALAGGVLGVGLTYLATGLLAGLIPPDIYRVGEISVDGRVLAFTSLVALSTPLFFALAPGWTATRAGLIGGLKEGAAGSGVGKRALSGRRALVVAEVALGFILVAGTGLMMRSLANALATDVGFPAEQILTVQLVPPEAATEDPTALNASFRSLAEGLSALPGVESVGSVSHLPLNHEVFTLPYTTPEDLSAPPDERPEAITSRAGTDYFQAMEIPVLAGRTFRPEDGELDAPGVVVSRSLAERLWPGRSAVGQTLVYGRTELSATVLGVVADVTYHDLGGPPAPHIYRPLQGTTSRRRFLVVRAGRGSTPASLMEPVRRGLFETDPDLPAGIRPMMDIVRESTGLWALSSLFLGMFGLVALGLAALGIYGVVAFSVAQRQREMGVRIALGADGRRLLRRVMGEGIRVTAVGLGIGAVGAIVTGILLSSLLLGVGPVDPLTLCAVAVVFLTVASLSTMIPARKAAAVEPVQALRSE